MHMWACEGVGVWECGRDGCFCRALIVWLWPKCAAHAMLQFRCVSVGRPALAAKTLCRQLSVGKCRLQAGVDCRCCRWLLGGGGGDGLAFNS